MAERRRTDVSFGNHLDGQYDVADQLRAHVVRRTAEALERGRRTKAGIATLDELEEYQHWLSGFTREMIDDDVPVDREPPVATCTGTVDRGDHVIEKLLLDCGDGVIVTANLYRPQGHHEPGPAVLFCTGHALTGKAAPAYHEACTTLVRAGFIVLTFDTMGQGERFDLVDEQGRPMVPPNVAQHSHVGTKVWWAGGAPARYFIADARRALDHLAARPEVDPERIAALGNSGGGTLVCWLTLLEPRLAAAGIGCFLSGIQEIQASGLAQDSEQIIPGGVGAGIDHDDFLLAMAPRPTIVLSKRSDFFPIEGTARSLERASRVFALAGVPDRLRQVRDDGIHGFSPLHATAAAEFFAHHLGPVTPAQPPAASSADGASFGEVGARPASERELQCTRTGQVSTDGHPVPVLASNVARLLARPIPSAGDAVTWLDDRVRAHRTPAAELFPRWYDTSTAGIRKVAWWTEVDLLNAAVVFGAADGTLDTVEILLLDHGTDDLADHLSWCRRRQERGVTVVVPDVRGTGAVTPRDDTSRAMEAHYGTLFRFGNELIALGDSLAAGRIHDVLRVIDLVVDADGLAADGAEITLVGHGHGAFLVQAAAALDPRVAGATVLTPPFDPRAEVAERFHGDERDAVLVIPGMAQHCPPESLRAALGDRLRTGDHQPIEAR